MPRAECQPSVAGLRRTPGLPSPRRGDARGVGLGTHGTEAARQALAGRAEVEADAWVREEIEGALNEQ